jgi:hypothetical protein
MPRATLAVQNIALAGLTPSYAAADAAGAAFANDGETFLQVKNAGNTACVVTIQTPATFEGVALADPTVTVPITTGDKMIGPFPKAAFNQVNGQVYVDFDQVVSVTVAAIHMP